MPILRFRVYWDDDESVYRDVAIKHSQTFEDLHYAILKSFEFDDKHQATFYKSNDHWKRGKQITFKKYDISYKVEPLIMKETIIGPLIRDPNQKFIYVYDFEKEWTFRLELINVGKEEEHKYYPYCTRKEGVGPSQYGPIGTANKKLSEVEEKYNLKTGPELSDDNEQKESDNKKRKSKE